VDTIKVIATFGDSWPGGAELGSGKAYGHLLQEKYGFDQWYNYGMGGASNEHMLFQFQRHIKEVHQPNHQTTTIFFLTNPGRTVQWPLFMSTQTDHEDLKKVIVHLFSTENEIMRYNSTVSALQFWCQNLGITDWYFAGWNRYQNWMPGVNLDKIWAQGQETAADWFGASKHNGEHLLDVGDNPYIRPNFCHPNQLGHQLIADRLAQWIGLRR
jgi:hypothetical protein